MRQTVPLAQLVVLQPVTIMVVVSQLATSTVASVSVPTRTALTARKDGIETPSVTNQNVARRRVIARRKDAAPAGAKKCSLYYA
jgi:hypothetical protein